MKTCEAWTAIWRSPKGAMTLRFAPEPGISTTVIRARCPDHPANNSLGIVLVRRVAVETTFRCAFVWTPVETVVDVTISETSSASASTTAAPKAEVKAREFDKAVC